jgi:hypothetical protein
MATIKLVAQFTVDLGGEFKSSGDLVTELTITAADGDFFDVQTTVFNDNSPLDNFTLVTLWNDGDGGLADFDFLWFTADAECLLLLIHDRANTPKYTTVKIAANIPYILSSDAAYNLIPQDGTLITLDKIDQIKCKNETTSASADTTVNCRLVLVT